MEALAGWATATYRTGGWERQLLPKKVEAFAVDGIHCRGGANRFFGNPTRASLLTPYLLN